MPGGRPRKPEPKPPRRAPGTGTVTFHKPSQQWVARLPKRLDATPASSYHATRAEASAWLDVALVRLLRPPDVISDAITLVDWLERWHSMMAPSAGWSERTKKIYRDHFRYFVLLHDRPLIELTTVDLQAVVVTMLTEGAARDPDSKSTRKVEPMAPVEVRNAVSTIRRALAAARDDGLIPTNPAMRVVIPRVVRKRPTLWTPEELKKLAPVIATDRLEALWILLLTCGLRIGEAMAITWDDLDHDERTVSIHRTMFKDGRIQEWPKSRRPREVDLPTLTWAALMRHKELQPAGGTWVFESPPGKGARRDGSRYPYSYDGIRYRLERLTTLAGIPYHPTHTGRHVHATQLLVKGVPAADVAERLGHADASVTLKLYASPSPEGRRRALAAAETTFDD